MERYKNVKLVKIAQGSKLLSTTGCLKTIEPTPIRPAQIPFEEFRSRQNRKHSPSLGRRSQDADAVRLHRTDQAWSLRQQGKTFRIPIPRPKLLFPSRQPKAQQLGVRSLRGSSGFRRPFGHFQEKPGRSRNPGRAFHTRRELSRGGSMR